ncbi:lipoprotein VacJ-like protein [Legionella busanensis]|uniref:Lipoprotein VacJ-like protein n=1 Tax=Legionella busanensis TaxID=190655 RepID=A0A378JVM3_9GAMM|nr:lipoprotein VacJ-like protein [Legionella busanensis]
MRLNVKLTAVLSSLFLSSCIHTGTNPDDPYEPLNRKVHNFNMAFDATMLKPPAKLYTAVVPAPVRASVNNFYNNINMIPTVANDLLQADFNYALKDTWRFFINSTFGIGGLFDVANDFGLPSHSNDLGLTLAKWGHKKSAYLVIPFLGPSTIRDGAGMLGDYFLTPYSYISFDNYIILYSLLGLRYIDLRAQYLDKERVLEEALDKYTFLRDAYLQNRNYRITGELATNDSDTDELYVDGDDEDEGEAGADYVDDEDQEAGSDYIDDESSEKVIKDKKIDEISGNLANQAAAKSARNTIDIPATQSVEQAINSKDKVITIPKKSAS